MAIVCLVYAYVEKDGKVVIVRNLIMKPHIVYRIAPGMEISIYNYSNVFVMNDGLVLIVHKVCGLTIYCSNEFFL